LVDICGSPCYNNRVMRFPNLLTSNGPATTGPFALYASSTGRHRGQHQNDQADQEGNNQHLFHSFTP
jgi:hypothetical protein